VTIVLAEDAVAHVQKYGSLRLCLSLDKRRTQSFVSGTQIAHMNLRNVILYILVGAGVLLLARILIGIIFGIIGVAIALITLISVLFAVGVMGYGSYRLFSMLRGTSSSSATASSQSHQAPESEDSISTLKEQYARGELSEREFERRLEYELDDSSESKGRNTREVSREFE
jgi:Predicted membrane protein (DUF2078).